MAVGLVDRQKLVNIADAVRAKKGITGNMTLDAIASNIASIPTVDNNAKFDYTGSGSNSSGSLLSYLTTVDLSGLDTSSYTDMSSMFSSYSSLTSLDLSSFNTSKVTNMNSMFYNCSSLTSLDLSSFNTSKVTNMSSMFDSCSSLTSLDLSNWNTSSVGTSGYGSSFKSMFNNCTSLESLDISSFDLSNTYNGQYYSLASMFSNCTNLKTLKLPNSVSFNKTDIYLNGMFYNCNSLESLDLSGWDTTNVTSMHNMFYNCNSLESLDLSGWNTTNVTDMESMFSDINSNCISLKNLTLGENWASNSSITSFYLNGSPLTHDSAIDVINKLATRDNSPVIKFSSKVGLYQSDIDIATNKGWSVSGCSVLVEDPSTATVGQYALIDGEMAKCVYVADTPQAWGQRVFTTFSHFKNSNGVYRFQWGGYETETGIKNYEIGNGLSNTNALIAMNLQSTDGTPTVWDAITEFRSTHSDRWFVPCRDEVALLKEGNWSDVGNSKWSSSEYETLSDIYVYVSLYDKPYFRNADKNLLYYLKPFTYV